MMEPPPGVQPRGRFGSELPFEAPADLRLHYPTRKGRFEAAADVVVVGSGAAGASAALVFAEAGLRVLVIEEGLPHTPSSLGAPMLSTLGGVYRSFGALPARGRSVIPLLQARAVGGTTVVNGAITWRLPGEVLRSWRDEHGLGEVLDERRLTDAYDTLDRLLDVAPTAGPLLAGSGLLMARGAAALGIDGRAALRNVTDCRGSGRCLQGCPHGAKNSMDRSLLPRACSRGAGILPGARAARVDRDARGAAAVTGELVDLEGRPRGRFRVLAERAVVLAASVTGTAPLLAGSGLGHPGLGRGFMAHPGLSLGGRFPDPLSAIEATQSWESGAHRDRGYKLESLRLPESLALARLPGVGAELAERAAALDRTAFWAVQVRAKGEGTVRPGLFGPRVRYRLRPEDLRAAAEGLRTLGRMFFAAGAEEVYPGVHGLPPVVRSADELLDLPDRLTDPRQVHFIATHLFGGARMGPDPRVHPVDLDFQVRGLPRCWIVDSSVFPTNLGVNPQHTMLAVARLAAERIVGMIG